MMHLRRAIPAAAAGLLLFSCAAGAPPLAGGAPSSGSDSPAANVPGASPAESPPPDEGPRSPEAPEPRKAVFVPYAAPPVEPAVPAAIGSWPPGGTVSASRRSELTGAYRAAYRLAALRGLVLKGSLGGDLLHFWSAAPRAPARGGAAPVRTSAGTYVQNWRGIAGKPNSWGLSDLVLACAPAEYSRAFVVRGAFLDAFGKGSGAGGANGIAGYGAPLTDEFADGTGLAQRFEFGLFAAAPDGTVSFVPGEAPSAAGIPDGVGSAAPGAAEAFGARSRLAFRSAWAAAVDSGLPAAAGDGPVVREEGGGFPIWVQRFASSSWALVLSAGDADGLRPVIVYGPFLAAVGARSGGGIDFGRTGPPLTDPFPGPEGIVQLFAKGRLELKPE